MFKKSFFPIITGLLLTMIAGCASDDRQYFDFEIQEIDETLSPEVLTGKAIELEYPKFILFSVYDTLCFLYSWDNPGGFYNLHNLKNGKHLGYFCQRGQAPNESAGISPLFQFYTEDGHLKTDLLTVNGALTPWDISGSLSSGQTELDTVFRFQLVGRVCISVQSLFPVTRRQYIGFHSTGSSVQQHNGYPAPHTNTHFGRQQGSS